MNREVFYTNNFAYVVGDRYMVKREEFEATLEQLKKENIIEELVSMRGKTNEKLNVLRKQFKKTNKTRFFGDSFIGLLTSLLCIKFLSLWPITLLVLLFLFEKNMKFKIETIKLEIQGNLSLSSDLDDKIEDEEAKLKEIKTRAMDVAKNKSSIIKKENLNSIITVDHKQELEQLKKELMLCYYENAYINYNDKKDLKERRKKLERCCFNESTK